MTLTKRQATQVIMWSLFNDEAFQIYSEEVLSGKSSIAAYLDALKYVASKRKRK